MATRKITLTNEDADTLHPVTEISAVENLNVNGVAASSLSDGAPLNIFTPINAGTKGKVLKSTGNSAPAWEDIAGLETLVFGNTVTVYVEGNGNTGNDPEEYTNWTAISSADFAGSNIFYTNLGSVVIFSIRMVYDFSDVNSDTWFALKIPGEYLATANAVSTNVSNNAFTSKKWQDDDTSDLVVYFFIDHNATPTATAYSFVLIGSTLVIEPECSSVVLTLSVNTDSDMGILSITSDNFPRITASPSGATPTASLAIGANEVHTEDIVWCNPSPRYGFTTPSVTATGIILDSNGYGVVGTDPISISIDSSLCSDASLGDATISFSRVGAKVKVYATRSPGAGGIYYKTWIDGEESEPSGWNLHYFTGDSEELIATVDLVPINKKVVVKYLTVASDKHGDILTVEED